MRLGRLTPLIFLGICCAGAGYVALHFSLHGNLGPSCDLKEQFATPKRPAYTHHCVCWGIKYNENPQPGPGADATRCFGTIRRSWTDTDDIAVKMTADREQAVKSEAFFERLSPEAKARVQAAYRRLREGAFRHDYPYMLEQTKAIFLEVGDYGDTKALETMARVALEKQGLRAAPVETAPVAPATPAPDPAKQ